MVRPKTKSAIPRPITITAVFFITLSALCTLGFGSIFVALLATAEEFTQFEVGVLCILLGCTIFSAAAGVLNWLYR